MGYVKKAGGKPAAKRAKEKVGKKATKGLPVIHEEKFPHAEIKNQNLRDRCSNPIADDNLSDAHIHFCRRYAIHGNGSKASREAGFGEQYYNFGLKQEPLLKLIDQFRAERTKKFELSADKVIAELCRVAFGNMNDFVEVQRNGTPIIDCSNVGREEMAALSSIEQDTYYERGDSSDDEPVPVKKTKIKFYDKLRALEMLARNLKLFNEEEIDNMTPEDKARKIRNALLEMARVDGDTPK